MTSSRRVERSRNSFSTRIQRARDSMNLRPKLGSLKCSAVLILERYSNCLNPKRER